MICAGGLWRLSPYFLGKTILTRFSRCPNELSRIVFLSKQNIFLSIFSNKNIRMETENQCVNQFVRLMIISPILSLYLLRNGIAEYLYNISQLLDPRMMMDVLKLFSIFSRRKDCINYYLQNPNELDSILQCLSFITQNGPRIGIEMSLRIESELRNYIRLGKNYVPNL
jgi:hypothetical protein